MTIGEQAIWPRADEDGQNRGWVLAYEFLQAIKAISHANGEEVSLEQVEQVLLAAEAHAILAKLPESEPKTIEGIGVENPPYLFFLDGEPHSYERRLISGTSLRLKLPESRVDYIVAAKKLNGQPNVPMGPTTVCDLRQDNEFFSIPNHTYP